MRLAIVAMLAAALAGSDKLAQAPSRFASLDGLRVHYKVLGSGEPTLVLVHGWTCNLGFWKGQAALADSARLVLVDLPGHGQSDQPERTYSMELMARAGEAGRRGASSARARPGRH